MGNVLMQQQGQTPAFNLNPAVQPDGASDSGAIQGSNGRVIFANAPVFSSAGVTTGVDLMLFRISKLCGPAVAAMVAQTLVVALRRGPQDPELSPFLAWRQHLHAAIHRVQDAVSQDPAADWTLQAMAALAATSPRHLSRRARPGCAANLFAPDTPGLGAKRTAQRTQCDTGRSVGGLQFRHAIAPGMEAVWHGGNAVVARVVTYTSFFNIRSVDLASWPLTLSIHLS